MENINIEKEFPRISRNGLRLMDQLLIIPAFGQRKKVILNRTSLEVLCEDKIESILLKPCCVSMPRISKGSPHLHFELFQVKKVEEVDKTGRYRLKTLNDIPFKLNGQTVFECFPERGDIIGFGYHQIKFVTGEQVSVVEEFPFENRICESMINILIEGETGTGKTRLAKSIHEKSNRNGRFVHLNLSSFSSGLIESELFGHVRGAFTGAMGEKTGALLEADKGTLFLDEIDSIPLELQVKLLLFLDKGEFRQVGGQGVRKTKARVIFASGRRLEELVDMNLMRKDFFFRLKSGVSINLKPLRDDQGKIEAICRSFALEHGLFLHLDLIEKYQKLSWPGNARQLLGHLEKKRVLSGGEKLVWDDNDDSLKVNNDLSFLPDNVIPMREWKQSYALKVLERFEGNIRQASDVLKISQNTLRTLVGR